MKRTVPLLLTAIAGFVLIVSFFVPPIQELGEVAAIWFDILASIAFILGGGNLLKLHLKSISDRKSGWGYSAVTIVAFLTTLVFGLLKIGSAPTPNVEFYGETFVLFPLSGMPEYSVEGALPQFAKPTKLPASVRRQLRAENGLLIFRGWMTGEQKADLFSYRETLSWHALVEQLFEASQPAQLQGHVNYYPKHQALAVSGVLTDELKENLQKILPDTPHKQRAIDELDRTTHVETHRELAFIPESFQLPNQNGAHLRLDGNTLTAIGPMSLEVRSQLVGPWAGFAPAMPLTLNEEQELLKEIEKRGSELNIKQRKVFTDFFAAEWKPQALIAAVNTAGIQKPGQKTAAELLAEQARGEQELNPRSEPAPPKLLNVQQKQLIVQFVEQSIPTVEDLKSQLQAVGELTDAQASAIDSFLASLPRQAEQMKSLGIELLKTGALSEEQREYLFSEAARQHLWAKEVGRLFLASHQVKYPWSGDYSSQGNPFWWVYEFVLQPLMTTTFAMLAFYVASAAFRAFRAKNLEATLLLGTAFIVLLGRTYLGVQLTAWIPDAFSALKIDQMTVYIMKIFNTAGNRAIMIGIALGIASTSLKVLLGIDRSYLGSSDD